MSSPTVLRYNNMDLMRYFFAIGVITAHYNSIMSTNFCWFINSNTAVGLFFAISGYLVYGSYEKSTLKSYVFKRVIRICPPYLFIILSSFLIGSILTSYTITEYLLNIETYKYLLYNLLFLNFLQPNLPGVFCNSAVDAVNGSLWTLKVEWFLYFTIPIFFYVRKKNNWNICVMIVSLLLFSLIYKYGLLYLYEQTNNKLYYFLSYQFAGQLMFFYSGVLIYHYKEKFSGLDYKITFPLFCIILILSKYFFITPIPFAIITTIFCISKSIGQWVSYLGNVSYEMYLFHFPIIQVIYTTGFLKNLPVTTRFVITIIIISFISVAYQKFINPGITKLLYKINDIRPHTNI